MSWQGWLAFSLYIGAANAEATPAQRTLLRTALPPLIQELRVSREAALPILQAVTRIMGPGWRPTGDWAHQIDLLVPPGADAHGFVEEAAHGWQAEQGYAEGSAAEGEQDREEGC